MKTALALIIFLTGILPVARANDLFYTDEQADCAAQMIYMNECSGKEANLVFWSPHEAFPSLGIGHFIWYPEAMAGPYRESFPGFLAFARLNGVEPPAWVMERILLGAPWRTREEFERDLDSERVKELRNFLRDNRRVQAHYILDRFRKVFPRLLDDMDEVDRESTQRKYDLLMARPEWSFAMVDYVNFKGEGFRSDARYEGAGWGLAQVLVEMKVPDYSQHALNEFILAAERVLERRVRLSKYAESQWLPGWKNRLRGYRYITCY